MTTNFIASCFLFLKMMKALLLSLEWTVACSLFVIMLILTVFEAMIALCYDKLGDLNISSDVFWQDNVSLPSTDTKIRLFICL